MIFFDAPRENQRSPKSFFILANYFLGSQIGLGVGFLEGFIKHSFPHTTIKKDQLLASGYAEWAGGQGVKENNSSREHLFFRPRDAKQPLNGISSLFHTYKNSY